MHEMIEVIKHAHIKTHKQTNKLFRLEAGQMLK